MLETAGPCSMSELGERLGRAPDSLYFHVRRLLRVGLIVETGRRQVGRHAFVIYDLVGRPLRIDRSKARPSDLQAVVTGILRLAIRDYKRGLTDPAAVADGSARNHWGGRVRGWLDAGELARVNGLLEELSTLLRHGRPGPGRQPIALAWVLAPVPARRAARSETATRSDQRAKGERSRTRSTKARVS